MMDNHTREPQKMHSAKTGWTLFSPVATVCLVIIAADMTTTENIISTNDTDDFIMEMILFRQCCLEGETSSVVVDEDERPGDLTAAERSVCGMV